MPPNPIENYLIVTLSCDLKTIKIIVLTRKSSCVNARHTVASARYADLSRGGGGVLVYDISGRGGGYPVPGLGGKTIPNRGGGDPIPRSGRYHRYPPSSRPEMGYPPRPHLGWGTPPPRNVNRQTPVKTVPFRHTTYAGGN